MQRKHSHALQKTIGVLLALIQLFSCVPAAMGTTVDNVEVAAAALVSSSNAINGMVRVFLSSLGTPSLLNLTVVGSYSVNGNLSQSLSSGSAVSVGFSSSTGRLTLTYNGSTTDMGSYFALRRHSTSGTNGIKISQAKQSANPYPGDLSFQVVRQSSGSYKLYTVAHIYIENYLYGVLPYEMGNSSNVEALKAQAVAARTYTVRMMQSRSGGYYDVADTTSDQVYCGTPSGNANCVTAVDSTKGIVLKYGSSYTMTYYSASNGGQTESVQNAWGSGGYDYLGVKDDPFDLANPSSTVKSKTIYKDLTSSANPAGLTSLLLSKAVTALRNSGYGATTSNTVLQTLKSVTPHTPKYSSPSRLYTKMDFIMTASVGGGAGTSVTVTCDIFSELESLLGMSIQSSKNELWSVNSSSSAFTLQARRYGHGLGLSQRGAMYMGKLGYTYDEILGFYYPGCKRVQQSFTSSILSASSGDEQTTVENPADLTDDNDSSCKGTVKLVSSSASLAIRTAKSVTASLIGTAGNGAIVKVLTNDGSWCYIEYGSLKGFVPTQALSITGTPSGSEGAATSVLGFASVTANDYVNLRSSASVSSSILSTAPSGAVLTVFSTAGGWASIQYCSTVAYASMSYLSAVTTSYPSAVSSTGSSTAVAATEDGTGSINLRATASTDGSILAQIPSGSTVTVSSDDGSWANVTYNGKTGYLMSSFLTYQEDTSDKNNNADSNGQQDPNTETSVYASVATDVGYIREQQSSESASKMLLVKGDTVVVTEQGAEWCAVTYSDITGYMLTASLIFSGSGSTAVGKAIVTTASGSLNMRTEAKAGSQIITTIPKGTEVELTSTGVAWCGVRYNGLNGYVMTSFLTITQGSIGSTDGSIGSDTGTGSATAVVTTQSGSLNLRAEARSGSTILRTISRYATVTVSSKAADWCNVTYAGTTGYVMTVFLSFNATGSEILGSTDENGTATPGTGSTTDPNDPDEPLTGDSTTNDTLYATVSTVSGSLNLRVSALPGSAILARIPKGATIVISERLAAWSQTTYAGQTGYVMNSYLTFLQSKPSGGQSAASAIVNTVSGSLNLRTEPNASSGVIARIPQYATVTVQQRGTGWCYVTYGSSNGYVMTNFLTFHDVAVTPTAAPTQNPIPTLSDGSTATPSPEPILSPVPSATPQPTENVPQTLTAVVNTASGSLNLRQAPQSGAQVLTTIPQYASVTVLNTGSAWCQVSYTNVTGYVMTQYLLLSSTGATAATVSPSSTSATETTAWVLTASGSLNLRETPSGSGKLLLTIPRLTQVSVLQESNGWSYLRYNGYVGYVMSNYLTKTNPITGVAATATPTAATVEGSAAATETAAASTSTPAPTQAPALVLDATLSTVSKTTTAMIDPAENQEKLGVWFDCQEKGTPLMYLDRGVTVTVLKMGQEWCQVQYEQTVGYCLTLFLTIQEDLWMYD